MTKHLWIGTSWKMNKLRAEARAFAAALAAVSRPPDAQLFVIPPFPYIADVSAILAGTGVMVGAQNMHWDQSGAWTGEVSPPMIRDCGATLVEIGHSERRTHFGETDETVALKTRAALDHGLMALVCIGDTREEYEAGRTTEVLERQARMLLKYVGREAPGKVLIAYEPVWSIGEGGVPADPDFSGEQHRHIKAVAKEITGSELPVLYGGSVNLGNCRSFASQSHIDGLFIGRSAWEVGGYLAIISEATKIRQRAGAED